jgi:hypothetical protein
MLKGRLTLRSRRASLQAGSGDGRVRRERHAAERSCTAGLLFVHATCSGH